VAFFFDGGVVDNDDGRLIGAGGVGRAKGDEVVPADEHSGGLAHASEVERFPDPPHVFLQEGGAAGGDLIKVSARRGVVTRVEVVGTLDHVQDADIGRQTIVQRAQDFARRRVRPLGTRPKMRDLSDGVDARVGAAGALDVDLDAEEILRGFTKLALDGARVQLFLPAAIFGAVVFEGQLPGFQEISVTGQR